MYQILPSSWSTLMRLSAVTLFFPADRISPRPLRHRTVSFPNGTIITHVSSASFPSVTTAGPEVPDFFFNGKFVFEINET